MPGVLLNNDGLSQKRPCSSKADYQWTFSFRDGYQSDSDSGDEGCRDRTIPVSTQIDTGGAQDKNQRENGGKSESDTCVKAREALSSDAQLLRDLDIATRAEEDAAEFKANPWSIARVNAASRVPNTTANQHPAPNVVVNANAQVGPSVNDTPSGERRGGATPGPAAASNWKKTGSKSGVDRNIEGFFIAKKVDTSKKKITANANASTKHTSVIATKPTHFMPRLSNGSSPLQTQPSPVLTESIDLHHQRQNVEMIHNANGFSDPVTAADAPSFAHNEQYNGSATSQDHEYLNEIETNSTDSHTENILEHLATVDSETLDDQLIDYLTPPRASYPPEPNHFTNASRTPLIGGHRAFSRSQAPFGSQTAFRLLGSQGIQTQGPRSSPLPYSTNAFICRPPSTPNVGIPRLGPLPTANFDPHIHPGDPTFSSLGQYHSEATHPVMGDERMSGRAALGLTPSGLLGQGVGIDQTSNQRSRPQGAPNSAAAEQHIPSWLSDSIHEASIITSDSLHTQVVDGGDCRNYDADGAEENEFEESDDSPPVPAPNLTSYAHPRSRVEHPDSSPPRLPFPSKRSSAVTTTRTGPGSDRTQDAYSAFQDVDADWSTLPVRKKSRKDNDMAGGAKGGAKSMKQSGRFRLPIALPPPPSNQQTKRRVITYLPPPRNVESSAYTAVVDHESRPKETVCNIDKETAGPEIRPVSKWAIKRFGYGRPVTGAKPGLYAKVPGLKLHEDAPTSRRHVQNDASGGLHSSIEEFESTPTGSGDSDVTLCCSNPESKSAVAACKSQAPSQNSNDGCDISIAFDVADVVRSYQGAREAMLNVRRSSPL